PFDITHTTVNFMVNLKAGAALGDALPGATVSFFRDMAGNQLIGDTISGEDGMASYRIARMPGSHVVYAKVAPPAGDYHPDVTAMQAVTWDAKMTMHAASNASDILNTKADFSFSGATVTTDFGGGKALGEWAISVSSDKSAAADTPDKLDAMGKAKYSEVVMADSLPVKYTVAVAANQANTLDGGEKYMPDTLMYEHDGLSLPATTDAGMLEVKYTTQTLKVYVHNERDQVMGFTGNVLGGDVRMSGVLDIAIRHIERSSGRSRAFLSTDKVKASSKGGVYTFSNVPASAQVIVQADVKAGQNVKLLGEDELDAYTDNDENGRMKGAFGDNGGYNHTVELCPLMSRAEDQRHGECSSFAFVNTYHVHGQVWEYTVATDGAAGGFRAMAKTPYKGVVVSMDPVDGENLAGDADSYTSGTDNKATKNFNEALFFDWERKAAGEYKLTISGGWVAKVGAPDDAVPFGNQVSPLGADLQIDVSPTTGYVYGTVTDSKGFRVEGATVSANGATATTDAFGRYRIRGFSGATINKVEDRVGMTVSKAGFAQGKANIAFEANEPAMQDFELSGEAKTATVSGTVRSSGNPVAGVTITVNGGRPLGATKDLKTGADGTYTALVPVGNVTIAPAKAGMSFFPESHTTTTTEGGAVSGLDFTGYAHGTITGRVLSTSGGPMSGVTVTATPAGGGDAADSDDTDVRGVYSLSVPFGRYTVAPSAAGYTFATEDGDASVSVNVASGGTESIEDFEATALSDDVSLSEVTVDGAAVTADDDGNYAASVASDATTATIAASATHADATVAISMAGDADDADQSSPREVTLDDDGSNEVTVTVTAADGIASASHTVKVTNQSSENMLSSLTVNGGAALVADDDGNYATEVANNVTMAEIAATAADANATVTISMTGDADDADQSSPRTVDLGVGETMVTVTVTPEDANAAASSATLTITRAHAMVTLSAPASVEEGGEATITASVDHAQAAEFTVTVSVTGDGTLGDNADLTFPAGETDATGTVTVTAANNAVRNDPALAITVSGSTDNTDVADIDDVMIAVEDDELVATAPRNLMVSYDDGAATPAALADGSARLTWQHPQNGGGSPITGYKYQATADGKASVPATATTGDLTTLDSDGDGTYEVTLTGLELGVEYTFSVQAVSGLGDGDAATAMVEAKPLITMALDNSTITEDGTTTATVTLTLSAASTKDVTITVATDDAAKATVANATVTIPVGQTAVPATTDAPVITAVQNAEHDGGTSVTFNVSASSDDARSPDDAEVAITDDDDLSTAPRNLVIDAGDAQLTVQWQSPATPGGTVTHYEFQVYDASDATAPTTWQRAGGDTGDAGVRELTLTHLADGTTALENGTAYIVNVRAVTAAGNGAAVTGRGTPSDSE
ncbi:MAG: hypothetical protein F4029_20895, partial [Gammaproteobacteria bacterium]|nr:hypothetical protein [Gammaproteobacteria bacterium]